MELLNRKEAAEFLRVSQRKLDQLAADGDIPYSKMGSGIRARVVYDLKDLEDYVLRQKIDLSNVRAHRR